MAELELLPDNYPPYSIVTEGFYDLKPEVNRIIQDVYSDSLTGKNGIIKKLKRLIGKYPEVNQFRNYLVQAYSATGNIEQAKELNDQLLNEFPDYLFARLFHADYFLKKGGLEVCKEMLGENLELHELYPERNEFHISEFMSYQRLAIEYFSETDNIEEAERRLSLMEQQDLDHPFVALASLRIMRYNGENASQRWKEGEKYRRNILSSYDKDSQTTEVPVYNHSEIEVLYHNNLRIDPELIRNLLKLPVPSLLEDLHKMLADSISRYEYFRDNSEHGDSIDFPLHTLFLLAELGSEESLPHLLNFMRQGEELLEFWLDDFLNGGMWKILFNCGRNQLSVLKDFVKEPNNYLYARSVLTQTVQQIALNEPERTNEVLEWYRSLLQFLLEKIDDENICDAQLNAFIIGDCIPLGSESLIDLITNLYEADVVDPQITGTLKSVIADIHFIKASGYEKENLFTDIYSTYDDVLTSWPYYSSGEDLDESDSGYDESDWLLNRAEQVQVIAEPKTGRNDPCPCGSGKKHKKCCLAD